jgi:hypothetical protein
MIFAIDMDIILKGGLSMEKLILEAYRKTGEKKFFAITKTLERLLIKRYGTATRIVTCTTKQVLDVLQRNQLKYVL